MRPQPPAVTVSSNFDTMEGNRGDRITKPVRHSFIVTMNIINTVTQFCLGGVVINALIAGNAMRIKDGRHVYLCVVGYMILMSQAILTFNPHAGWASALKHPQKRTIHWIMQVVGSILAIIGSVLKMSDPLEDSFQSAHGIVGFITMLLTSLSLIAGAINLNFRTQTYAKLSKTFHGCLGYFTITMAFITIFLAFNTYYRNAFSGPTANLAVVLTVGALAGILISSSTKILLRWLK